MTAFTTADAARRLAELDARTRAAWMSYRDELSSLEGSAYEDAEGPAWDQLQATLRELEVERAELMAPGDA